MEDAHFIFFSKNDIVLGEKLKTCLRTLGIDLRYFKDLGLLLDFVIENGKSIIFIEKQFSKYIHILSELVKSTILNEVALIFIDSSCELDKYINNRNVFKITETFHCNDLFKVIEKYRVATYDNLNYDINKINILLTQILVDIGISIKHAGYNYIKECVMYAVKNKFKLGQLNKEVYKYVACCNNVSVQNVERSIRNTITYAKKNNSNFVAKVNQAGNGEVTNKMVLAYILERLNVSYSQLEQDNKLKVAYNIN